MNKIKKPLALLLALMMLMTAMPLAAIPAFAAETVTYVDRTWDTTNKKVVEETKTATATPIESSTTAITLDGGWYVVSGNVEITAAITVSGTPDDNPTCIILKDGCKLTASKGIVVNSGKGLAIYAQTAGTGKLDAIGDSSAAGIGGTVSKVCGTITINGGTINATGGSTAGAGIGGGRMGAGGNITINGGTVTATGVKDSAGIGGGNTGKDGGTVTVNGGTITATGGSGAAGIGGGRSCKSFTVTINGGTVTATGGYDVNHDESGGAGIGGGTSGNGTGDSKISINGGTVNATGADGGAGIGSGSYAEDPGRTIIITGGNITAAGANGGSGIGSGRFSEDTDSTITITDGTVTATGADGGAGIGGGKFEEGDAVTITGGTVTATGASGGAGIGGGDRCESHGVLEADYEVMRAGDAAPGEDTTLDDYLTARSTYAYIHTHKFDSYTDNGDGTHSRTCACEAKENVKIDHTFVDGVCTFCGAKDPSVDLSMLSTGAKIQLGTQSGSPVEWVIGGDGTTGMSVPEGCIALVSSGLVASGVTFGDNHVYSTSNPKNAVESAVTFTTDEQAAIQSRTLDGNQTYGADCDGVAGDPVIASVWAPTTKDANALKNVGLSSVGSHYWLCSPGYLADNAALVKDNGDISMFGYAVGNVIGVRAALYLDAAYISGMTAVEGKENTYTLNLTAPEEEPGVDLSKLSTGKKIIYGTATYGSNNGKALEWVVAGDGKTGMEVPDGCIALALTNNVMKEYLFDNQDPIDNHYSTSNLTDIFNTGIALTKTQESAIKSRTLEGGKTAGDNCDGVAGDSVTVNFWAPTVKDANALKEVGLSATGWDYTLSSPGTYGTNYVACVSSSGNISVGGTEVNIWNYFRPAFYLDLSKIEAINEVEDAENTYTLDIMHTHAFSEKWSTDENAHWHECTAEECDIKDYSECVLEAVAYGEHVGMDDDYTCDTCGYVNAEGQLVNAVTEAKAALNTAKTNAKSDEAKTILDGAITALDEAESLDDVNTIKSDALENAEGADNALAEAIATAKSDLETAKNNAKSDAAKEAIADAIAELADATNLHAVENIVDKANNDAAEHDKELAEVKATAKEALNTALTNAKSDAAKAALNDAIATVDNATDPDTVAEAKTTGTINAAIADNALADAQAEAKKALETAKAEATSKEAKAAIDKAIANVEKATNPADVASAKSAGITAAANADKTLADTISNFKKNLETAKNDAKSDAAKAVYTNAIAALDNAKSLEDVETIVEGAEMNAANADKALADAKTDAKKELETAKTNAKSDAAKAALDEAIANVEKATSPAGAASAKSTGTTAAANADKALDDAKAEAKEALETAKAEAISKEAKAAIDKAIANVEKATNPADVASAKSAGTTAAANADKTLADTISNFKKNLETAKNDAKSDAAKAAYTDAIAALDNAKSLEDVETIVESAEMNAANADKALADAKTDAKKELETAKTNAKSDAAKAALDEAIANVDKATSPADVASAKSTGTTDAANADKALDDAKAEAKEALETAKENAKSDAAKAALDEAIANVDKATSPADVASEKAAAETAAAEADKALADAKEEAIEALETAKTEAVSDEAKAALDEAIADVEKATNPTDTAAAKTSGLENAADADEALAEAIENAKADLAEAEENAVADDAKAALSAAAEDMDNATSLAAVADKKAAAEEAAEAAETELADAKAAAIEAVEALAGEDATDEVKQLVEDAKEAINAATSPEAVDTAEDNGLATVEHKQKEEGFTVPDLDIQLGYREEAPVNAESTTNKIIYTSSNEKVVTVDEDGNLKAVGKGKATITATLEGTDISEEIEIEVSYTFWEGLVWHIRNLLELIASGFKWLLGLIGINL